MGVRTRYIRTGPFSQICAVLSLQVFDSLSRKTLSSEAGEIEMVYLYVTVTLKQLSWRSNQ